MAGQSVGVLPISRRLEENLSYLGKKLGKGESYDILFRDIKVAGRDAALVWIDGFVKDRETQEIISVLQHVDREDATGPNLIQKLITLHVDWFELNVTDNLNEVVDQVLGGPAALLIDGERQALIFDVRTAPSRGIDEPDTERVTRGPREGFTETMILNTVLIRRRLRDPGLRFEPAVIGERSKTDVVIGYIKDVANPRLIEEVRRRLQKVKTDAIPMGTKSLEEYLFGVGLNPLPRVRYTERPDVVVAHLLEGHFAVIADTVPVAMIGPTNLWSLTQHSEEYFQTPVVGTYFRWVRLLGGLFSLIVTPLWLALILDKAILPPSLGFLGPKEPARVPLVLQMVALEVGFDLIRMALIHTPNALATGLGIVGAVLLGQIAVQVGIFNAEPILYVAIVAIGGFAVPNLELRLALRIFRLVLLGFVIAGGLPGFVIGLFFIVLIFAQTSSLGLPYLWPLIPFDGWALLRVIFRYPVPAIRRRPEFASPIDRDTGSGMIGPEPQPQI